MAAQYERYVRQMIFPGIGEEGQARLNAARVVILGCGATGSHLADSLVRAGVGHVTVVDRDFIELNNLQRQSLFDEQDLKETLPKAVAAERKLKKINSEVTVTGIVADINAENIHTLVEGASLVMDGTDNFEARYLINDICVKLSIPWVYTGVIGSFGMSHTIIPHQTPCLRCLFEDMPAPGTTPTCDTAGVLGSAVAAIAGVSATEALKVLIGQGSINTGLIHLDLWENSFEVFETSGPRPDCPTCSLGEYYFLEADAASSVTSLCGRDAVQVRPQRAAASDLEAVAERLREKVEITALNVHLLRFKVNGYELTLFADGRAIVKGTDDSAVARGLYAKYIGM